MAIALRTCRNHKGNRVLSLCMNEGEFYINITENDETQTLISNVEHLEEIKTTYLKMVWELIY